MESMEQACGDITRVQGFPQTADDKEDVKELMRQHLSSEAAGQWLLVINNVDDMDLIFRTEESNGITNYRP
jgi:hypothetical protein